MATPVSPADSTEEGHLLVSGPDSLSDDDLNLFLDALSEGFDTASDVSDSSHNSSSRLSVTTQSPANLEALDDEDGYEDSYEDYEDESDDGENIEDDDDENEGEHQENIEDRYENVNQENVEDDEVDSQDIEDGDDNDDILQFLGDNDFSSPSILTHTSPLQEYSSPHVGTMPQTRRRTAAAAATRSPTPTTVNSSSRNPPPPPHSFAATTPVASLTRASSSRVPPRTSRSPIVSRTPAKRRHNGDPISANAVSPAPNGAILPPISTLLDSIGGGDSSSQNVGSQTSAGNSNSVAASNSQSSRSRISPKRPKRQDPIILDDDLFGSDDDNGVEVVDLINVDRPHAAKHQDEAQAEGGSAANEASGTNADKPESKILRLAQLQCVICMDDMTNLTVTHCGHLFCGECLDSSLTTNASANKICPICRAKIEMRTPSMSAAKLGRSFFPLQLKIRSLNKQGKQPARR